MGLRVPRTADYIKGLINLRSEVIPVVDLRRRFCGGGWWPASEDRELFNPAKVRTTRYRYRGTAIPTPWPIAG